MKNKGIFLSIIIVVLAAAALDAYGGEPFAFLKLGIGARATGMGCAFTSVADDVSAIFYNPAGTVSLNGMDLTAETYILSMGRNLNYAATAKPFIINNALYAVGFAWVNYSAGSDIEKRLTDSPDPDAVFSDSSNIFIFNVSTKLSDRILFGGNFKFFYEALDTYKGTGVGFDLGIISNFTDTLRAGLNVSNISSNITWNNVPHQESVPINTALGLSDTFRDLFGAKGLNLLVAGDVVYNSFSGFFPKAGVEFSANDFFYVRSGYGGTINFGAGLKLKPSDALTVRVDYAFLTDSIEPGAFNHRLGALVTYVFPKFGVESKKEAIDEQPKDKPKGPVGEYDW